MYYYPAPYLPSSTGSCVWSSRVKTAAKCSCLYWGSFKSVLAAVCLALIYQKPDTGKEWFQLKTWRQGFLQASSGAEESCPKKLSKSQPEPGIADLQTPILREFGRLKAGHKPEAVNTGHLTPVLWQTLVLGSFSPTEIFHLLVLVKTHQEPDWPQQQVPSPLTPSGAFL